MNLSNNQIISINTTIRTTIDKLNNKYEANLSKTKKHFLDKITFNYHKKSLNQFSYFLKYISNGHNKRTGESVFNLYDKYNSYKFQSNIYLADNNTTIKLQEIKKGQFLDNKQLQYANKKVAKALYIEHHNKNKNRVFITLTLPSKWHYYKNQGRTKNKLCMFDNYEDSLNQGLKQLNHINRALNNKINLELRRYYKRLNKPYIAYDYIKVLEYHTSLTPHYHSIIYCTDDQLEIIEKQYNYIIKKFELVHTVYEIIENKKASSYVYKYLLKNSLPSDDENNSLFNKYKSYFSNVRIFSSSNFKYSNQTEIDKVYKYISKHRPNLMKLLKKSKLPLYINLENMIKRGYFTFEYKEVEQIVVSKKNIENAVINIINNEFLPMEDEDIYIDAIAQKDKYVKIVKIKKLIKAYYIDKYTNKKHLIYDTTDFISFQKTDFDNELFGVYEDEPDF